MKGFLKLEESQEHTLPLAPANDQISLQIKHGMEHLRCALLVSFKTKFCLGVCVCMCECMYVFSVYMCMYTTSLEVVSL